MKIKIELTPDEMKTRFPRTTLVAIRSALAGLLQLPPECVDIALTGTLGEIEALDQCNQNSGLAFKMVNAIVAKVEQSKTPIKYNLTHWVCAGHGYNVQDLIEVLTKRRFLTVVWNKDEGAIVIQK